MENEKDYEGVEINISTSEWPKDLAGVRVGNKTFMVNKLSEFITFIGDPVWSIDGQLTDLVQSNEE